MGYWTDALVWVWGTNEEEAVIRAAIETVFERKVEPIQIIDDVWAFTAKRYPEEIIAQFKAAKFPDSFYPPVLMLRGEQEEFWRVVAHHENRTGCCHSVCAEERKKAEEAESKAIAYANSASDWSRRLTKLQNERAVDLSRALRENTLEWQTICRELNAKLKKALATNERMKKRLKK